MNTVEEQIQTDEKTVEQEQVAQPTEPVKRAWTINTPWAWMLLTAPLTGGAVWLATHPQIITDNINQPYALLFGPALAGSVLLLWITIKFFQSIITGSKAVWHAFQRSRKEDGSAQFFWIVIVVFMIVSVFASGSFFSKIEHDAVPGLGYATALFIDLVAVQAMRARLNAVRMRDKKGSRLYLFGVLLCAGASAFANVYTSLADFTQTTTTGALPPWMLQAAPWFGLVFPALILLLSMTADYTIDQISTKLDPEQYKEQERKRTKLLEYQRDALKDRLQFEREIDSLTEKLRDGKERRVFFLINWLFPVRQPNVIQAIESAINELRSVYDPQMHMLASQNLYLRDQLAGVGQQLASIDAQKETDLSLISQQISKVQTTLFDQLDQAKNDVLLEVLNQIQYTQDTDPLQPIYQEERDIDYTPIPSVVNEPVKEELATDIPATNPPEYSEIDEDTKKVFTDYPFLAAEHSTGVRSLSIEDIVKLTGHTPQMVRRREKNGVFKKTRRDGFYSITSVISWLQSEKLPAKKETTILAESSPDNSPNTEDGFQQKGARITGKLSEDMLIDTPAEFALV